MNSIKTVPWWVVVSFSLNVVLLVWVLTASEATETDWATRAPKPVATRTRGDWEQLQSESYPVLRDRLLAAGFPREVVIAVVRALAEERAATRAMALWGLNGRTPHWRALSPSLSPAAQSEVERSQLEVNAELRRLFGDDAVLAQSWQTPARKARFGDLSRDKVAAVQAILDDFADIGGRELGGGYALLKTATEAEKAAWLEKEKRADLEAVLSPQELLEYDVRNSVAASRLRSELVGFHATEAEFRALVSALVGSSFESRIGGGGGDLGSAAYQALEAEKLERVRAVLSAERYGDFAQASDLSSIQLNRLVTRLGLPLAAARELGAMRASVTAATRAALQDTTLSPEARRARAAEVVEAAKQRSEAILGAKGYAVYERSAGNWLGRVLSRPVAP